MSCSSAAEPSSGSPTLFSGGSGRAPLDSPTRALSTTKRVRVYTEAVNSATSVSINASADSPPLALSLPKGVTDERVLARRGLLNSLEQTQRLFDADPPVNEIDDFREMAFGMLSGSPAVGGTPASIVRAGDARGRASTATIR